MPRAASNRRDYSVSFDTPGRREHDLAETGEVARFRVALSFECTDGVRSGCLRPGDSFTLRIGDRRHGSPGCASFLKSDMVHVEDADAYRWPFYWSGGPSYPLIPRWEDVSHASATVLFAFSAYRSGIVFTEQDMKRLANTWTRLIAPPGADGAVAYRVSGDGLGDGHPSVVRRGWALLGLFDEGISRFAERWFVEHGSTTDVRQRLVWASLAAVLDARASDGKVREK